MRPRKRRRYDQVTLNRRQAQIWHWLSMRVAAGKTVEIDGEIIPMVTQ